MRLRSGEMGRGLECKTNFLNKKKEKKACISFFSILFLFVFTELYIFLWKACISNPFPLNIFRILCFIHPYILSPGDLRSWASSYWCHSFDHVNDVVKGRPGTGEVRTARLHLRITEHLGHKMEKPQVLLQTYIYTMEVSDSSYDK